MAESSIPLEGAQQAIAATRAKEAEQKTPFDAYFESRKPGLRVAISNAFNTRYGTSILPHLNLDLDNLDYKAFRTIPSIDLREVANDPEQFAKGDTKDMTLLRSGGTTGKPKVFYFPKSDIMPETFEHNLDDEVRAAENPVFLHVDYPHLLDFIALEAKLRAAKPDIRIETFSTVPEALKSMDNSDFVFLESVVTDFRTFMFYLEQIKKDNPALVENLKGKKFWLELNSEAVYPEELKLWYDQLHEIFGLEPTISITYGQNDTGFLGYYEYKPGDKLEDIKYLILKSKFVEVLDPEGNLIIDHRGDIIVTTLRDEGSIFLRYPSSDQGKITFDSRGRAYISEIARKPESGLISLGGHKFFASELYEALRVKLNIPFQVEIGTVKNKSSENFTLNINLYSDQFSNQMTQEQAQLQVIQILQEYEKVNPTFRYERWIRNGFIKLNIQTLEHPPKGFDKSWRVLPEKAEDN